MKYTLGEILFIGFFIFLPFERLLTVEALGLTVKISFGILMLLILYYLARMPKIKLDLPEKVLSWFLIYSFLSSYWSIDAKRSLIVSTIYAATFVGFFILRRVGNEKNIALIKNIIIYSGAALSIFALWQYFGDLYGFGPTFLRQTYTKIIFGFPRPQSTFLEPLYFANYLFMPLFFGLEKIITDKKNWFSGVIIALISMVFVLTLSRGAYIGFVVALIFVLVFCIIKFKEYWSRFLFSLIFVVIGALAAISLIYFSTTSSQFNVFVAHAGVTDAATGESTLGRWATIKLALNQSVKNPEGIGAGAFGALPEFDKLYQQGTYQTVGVLYPEILVEEGFIGLLLFLFFLFFYAKYQWQEIKRGKLQNLIYLAVFIAIFVQAFAFSSVYILPVWAFLALSWPSAKIDT